MATYYGTYGQKVQYLASDPSDPQLGQVWYNSTSAVLKVRSATTSGTWATGGNLATSRSALAGAGSNSSNFIVFGGTPVSTASESYNGTAWTNTPSLNTGRGQISGAGNSNTAALAFGGDLGPAVTTASESWNGSSWTNTPSINTGRRGGGGTGTNTSALYAGGVPPGTSTELWNGSSWTSNPTGLTTGQRGGLAGTQTSAVTTAKGGGNNPGGAGATQTWNGTSWTALPGSSYPSPAPSLSDLSLFGTQNQAVASSGQDGSTNDIYNQTNTFNGTTWTSSTTTPSAIASRGTSGISSFTDSLLAGGQTNPPVQQNQTIEWTGPGAAVTQTVTVS